MSTQFPVRTLGHCLPSRTLRSESNNPSFSHVVAYTRQTSALRGTADSLLDSLSYGARWVPLLSPAAAAAGMRGSPSPHP
jgi:hypothetical protein